MATDAMIVQPIWSLVRPSSFRTTGISGAMPNQAKKQRKKANHVMWKARIWGMSSRKKLLQRTLNPARMKAVNFKVSLDRANAVATELIRQGVPENRIEIIAQGANQPIYAESTATGEAANRRAEIFIEYLSEG